MPDGSEFDAIIIGAGVAEPDYSVKMDLPSIEALHFSIIPKFRRKSSLL